MQAESGGGGGGGMGVGFIEWKGCSLVVVLEQNPKEISDAMTSEFGPNQRNAVVQ